MFFYRINIFNSETISSVLFLYSENISYICLVAGESLQRHIDESVFALSLKRNLTVSIKARTTNGTVICIRLRVFNAIDTGVGIVSVYLLLGFVRTSL